MSYQHHYNSFQHPTSANPSAPSSHSHHAGRSRRAPRLSTSQNSHRQFRGVKSMKELTDTASISTFRQKFEAGRSFDLDDDMEFCPNLCTDEDYSSINSSSDRSSLSSGSPESSPTQQQTQPASFTLNSQSAAFNPTAYHQQHQQQSQLSVVNSLKIHQPTAARIRNAIPIVNPSTGISMSNPTPTASPARMGGRW